MDWRWKKMAGESSENVSGSELAFAIVSSASDKAVCEGLQSLYLKWGAEALAKKINGEAEGKNLLVYQGAPSKLSGTVMSHVAEEMRAWVRPGSDTRRVVLLLDFGGDPDASASGSKSALESSLGFAEFNQGADAMYVAEAMLSKSSAVSKGQNTASLMEKHPGMAASIGREYAKRQKMEIREASKLPVENGKRASRI